MAKVSYGEKQDQKAPRSIALLNNSFWKSAFFEGVRHFERQFQVDGDVARNRSMDRWIGCIVKSHKSHPIWIVSNWVMTT